MSKFGEVIGKLEGDVLKRAQALHDEHGALIHGAAEMSKQANDRRRLLWAGIREVLNLAEGRRYTFDTETGVVSDSGPEARNAYPQWGREKSGEESGQ